MPLARTSDEAEAARLLGTGGRLIRHAHEMVMDLRPGLSSGAVTLPAGVFMAPVESTAAELAAAAATATPTEHVDHHLWQNMDRPSYWKGLLGGQVTGPVLPEPSRILLKPRRGLIGAVVVTLWQGLDWWSGGPWIAEMFVVPAFQGQGLGSALLTRAVEACAKAGYERMGLTVSDRNPAKRLYERCGFRVLLTRWAIEV